MFLFLLKPEIGSENDVMQFLRTITLIFISLIAAPSMSQASSALCPDPLKVRFSADYLPFSYLQADGSLTGIDVEFIENLFRKIDCPISIVVMPFKRAVFELAAGDIDMMPFASITEERKSFAHFSAPYRNETVGLVFRKEDVDKYALTSLQDVIDHGLVLGHEQSAYRGEFFKSFLANPASEPHVFNVVSASEGIKMLSAGRIDAMVEMPAATLAMADKMGIGDRFAEHPLLIWSDPVHFMYSKKTVSPELVQAVNAALKHATETDSYKKLYRSMGIGHATLEAAVN